MKNELENNNNDINDNNDSNNYYQLKSYRNENDLNNELPENIKRLINYENNTNSNNLYDESKYNNSYDNNTGNKNYNGNKYNNNNFHTHYENNDEINKDYDIKNKNNNIHKNRKDNRKNITEDYFNHSYDDVGIKTNNKDNSNYFKYNTQNNITDRTNSNAFGQNKESSNSKKYENINKLLTLTNSKLNFSINDDDENDFDLNDNNKSNKNKKDININEYINTQELVKDNNNNNTEYEQSFGKVNNGQNYRTSSFNKNLDNYNYSNSNSNINNNDKHEMSHNKKISNNNINNSNSNRNNENEKSKNIFEPKSFDYSYKMNHNNRNDIYIPNKVDYNSLVGLQKDSQIDILLKENEKLSDDLRKYINEFGELPKDKDKNDIKNKDGSNSKLKLLLQKENKKLKDMNSKNNNTIYDLLDFINKINDALDKDKININELKKANEKENGIQDLLNPILKDIGIFMNDENKNNMRESNNEKEEKSKKEKEKYLDDFDPNYIDIVQILKLRNKKYNNNGTKEEDYKQIYYDSEKYKNRIYGNDFNTNKGFSPLMCSSNRYKYLP